MVDFFFDLLEFGLLFINIVILYICLIVDIFLYVYVCLKVKWICSDDIVIKWGVFWLLLELFLFYYLFFRIEFLCFLRKLLRRSLLFVIVIEYNFLYLLSLLFIIG